MERRESDYSRPTVKRRGMRTGYTTGATAAAASKAAVLNLLTGEPVSKVTIRLPIGEDATFTVHRSETLEDGKVLYAILKDGGDDPDATHGAEICASVSRSSDDDGEVTLLGGEGVGTVTRPGIGIPVGDPSITRVPQRLIIRTVTETAQSFDPDDKKGFVVEISVPNGEEIAKNTDNARLGIVGGISILGTTGVVQPFSTAAWRASVNLSIDVAAVNGIEQMVITTGTQSENFAREILDLPDMSYVNVGIFTGPSLKRCAMKGIRRATLVGMVGKFSKIAMGKFVTHVAGNKVDTDFLAAMAAECGASQALQDEIIGAASARHFQEIALEHGLNDVFGLMCEKVCEQSEIFLGPSATKVIVDCICFDFEGNVLGMATTSPDPIPMRDSAKSVANE